MKKYRIIISEQAEQDLRNIFEYLAYEFSLETALRILNRIDVAISELDYFPDAHRVFEKEPWRSRNLRILVVGKYCVFFISNHDDLIVTVIRVIYSGRDIDAQLNRFTDYEK